MHLLVALVINDSSLVTLIRHLRPRVFQTYSQPHMLALLLLRQALRGFGANQTLHTRLNSIILPMPLMPIYCLILTVK